MLLCTIICDRLRLHLLWRLPTWQRDAHCLCIDRQVMFTWRHETGFTNEPGFLLGAAFGNRTLLHVECITLLPVLLLAKDNCNLMCAITGKLQWHWMCFGMGHAQCTTTATIPRCSRTHVAAFRYSRFYTSLIRCGSRGGPRGPGPPLILGFEA